MSDQSSASHNSEVIAMLEKAIKTHANRHRTDSGMMYWKHEDQMTEDAMQAALTIIRSERGRIEELQAEVAYLAAANSLLTGRSVESIMEEVKDHKWP